MMKQHMPLFQPARSLTLFAYFIAISFFALVCVWVTFSGILFFIFSSGVFISLNYYFFYAHAEIIALAFLRKKEWILYFSADQIAYATLLGCSVMFRHMLILHFYLPASQQKKSVVLFSDQFSDEHYRALRRCVKMGYL